MPAAALLMLALAAADPVGADAPSVHGQALTQQVQATLQSRLAARGSSARVEVPPGAPEARGAGAVTFEVGEVAGRWPRPRATVPVRVRSNGRLLRTLTFEVTSTDIRRVPVFARDYLPHTRADRMRIEDAEVDMSCCAEPTLAALPQTPLRLRRAVRAGEPLQAADFEPVPEVEQQAPVRLEVRRGAIILSAEAKALQDGRTGDRVRVMPSYATQAVMASVVGPGEVEIHE